MLSFVYLSLSDLTFACIREGIDNPLSRWVQVVWLFVQVLVICVFSSYWIDTLVLKLWEILISTLVHHPFLFKGKTNASSRSSNGLCPPGGPADPISVAIKSYFLREKSRRKNYRVSRDGAAAPSFSSSGGQIWSPFGALERGIFDIRHHQPFSIANSMISPHGVSNSFVGSLVGEELDEIHHVIELVLLGLDP